MPDTEDHPGHPHEKIWPNWAIGRAIHRTLMDNDRYYVFLDTSDDSYHVCNAAAAVDPRPNSRMYAEMFPNPDDGTITVRFLNVLEITPKPKRSRKR
jgi:hypothetical protein